MTDHLLDATALVTSALRPGATVVPQRLLDAVTRLSQPLLFLLSEEPAAEPFEVFQEEYAGLHLRRCGARSLNPTETEQAVGLLRWALEELSAWTRKRDPRFEKMISVMVVLNGFGWSDAQWTLLPDGAVNLEFISMFCDTLNANRCEIKQESGQHATTTNDLLDSLVRADGEGDWAAISLSWQQIEPWLHGGFFVGCAVPCLVRFDVKGLASAMNNVCQIQMAYILATSLSEANRLRLARATSSRRYRFAAVLSIAWGRRAFTGIGDEAENELLALLAEVSQDTDQWPRWMQAFNEYPTRFPTLQRPLGGALAQASERALTSYVNAIRLTPWSPVWWNHGYCARPNGRQSVALCLKAFSEKATIEQRRKMWQLAHTRWDAWQFELKSAPERHLTDVVGCELDYAVTAHAAECLTAEQRAAQLDSLGKNVHDVEMSWHSSLLDLMTSRNALFSRMQPLLAADAANWLFAQANLPPEIVETPYTRGKFRTFKRSR